MSNEPSTETSADMNNEPWVLAIDFGTSYTVAASRRGDHTAEVIEIDGERRMPSIILLDDSGEIVVGRSAETLASTNPGRVLRAPKSRLGEPAPVVLGGKPHSISQLVASLLRYVHEAAIRYHGSNPSEVRLTHPATWSGPRRQQLLDAAESAGIDGATLVPEPVAAAIAYADDVSIPQGGHVVVYDLGGGTFDTAALQASPNGFIVMGRPGGDARLGGELFDELLANSIGESLDATVYEKLQLADDHLWAQAAIGLRREARRVKEALSSHPYADVLLGLPDGLIQQRIEQAQLQRVISPYIVESVEVMQQTASGAGLTADDIAAIYLVGGASRTPLVEELVTQAYPSVAISRRGDPKGVVAVGATHPLATPTSLAQRSSLDRASTLETPGPPPAAPGAAAPVTVADDPGTVVDSKLTDDRSDNATVVDTSQLAATGDSATRIDSAVGDAAGFAPPGVEAAAAQRASGSTPSSGGGDDGRKTKVAVGVGVAGLLLLGGIGLSLSGGADEPRESAASTTVTTEMGGNNNGSLIVVPTTVAPEPEPPVTTMPAPTTTAPPLVTTTIAPATTAAPAGGVIPSDEEVAAALVRASDLDGVGWADVSDDDPLIAEPADEGICGPEESVGLVAEQVSGLQNATGKFRNLIHTIGSYDSIESAAESFRISVEVYENCDITTAEVGEFTYDAFVQASPFDEDGDTFACGDDEIFVGIALTNGPPELPTLSLFLLGERCGSNVSVVGGAVAGELTDILDIDFAKAASLSSFRLNNLPGSR